MTDHETVIRPRPPYRLDLIVRVLRRRPDNRVDRWDGRVWRRTMAVGGRVCRWTAHQEGTPEEPLLVARLEIAGDATPVAPIVAGAAGGSVERTAAWARLALDRLLGLTVDVSDFHAFARRDERLSELTDRWRGFRPPRFPTLFEALLNAVACQQITLTQGIRRLGALAERFGRSLPEADGQRESSGTVGPPAGQDGRSWRALPEPSDLLGAPLEPFREMGFSRGRAETILCLAELAARGELEDERFQGLGDAEAVARLRATKGIGLWSAEYALLRGLGRLNVFPGDDVGARQNIQRWLGLTETPDVPETRRLFGRYAPWQGMVYFLVLLDRLEDVPGM